MFDANLLLRGGWSHPLHNAANKKDTQWRFGRQLRNDAVPCWSPQRTNVSVCVAQSGFAVIAEPAVKDSPTTTLEQDLQGDSKGIDRNTRRKRRKVKTQVVVIGSGIGGLSSAALLAHYGYEVTVCESHSIPGGCAHCWSRGDFHFDTGTSLFFGLSGAETDSPLTAVLNVIGEKVDVVKYGEEKTCLVWPHGVYDTQIGSSSFGKVIEDMWGGSAKRDWEAFQAFCKEVSEIATSIHPMALRYDAGVAVTTMLRKPVQFVKFLASSGGINEKMFSELVDEVVSDVRVRNFIDVLCKGTSGLPADQISASYMVRAFNELYQPNVQLEYPVNGSQSIVDALVRGLTKNGGKLYLNAHVDEVLMDEDGRACGVRLSDGREIDANVGVISNASAWDTLKLVRSKHISEKYSDRVDSMVMNDSFLHLHLGFDGRGLDDLPLHYFLFDPEAVGSNGWPTICIPSAVDATLAPSGKHVLHAYIAEPYDLWEGLDTKSSAYKLLKAERANVLWELVERVIPDIRSRAEVALIGTPLTHERFLRRHRGTYGPKNLLSLNSMPEPVSPIPGMYCCGDSTFPGVGTPAAAASGMWVANTLAPIWSHWKAMDTLGV